MPAFPEAKEIGLWECRIGDVLDRDAEIVGFCFGCRARVAIPWEKLAKYDLFFFVKHIKTRCTRCDLPGLTTVRWKHDPR